LRLKILKKLKTASLNPEFTGSYKKCHTITLWCTVWFLSYRVQQAMC